MSTNGKLTLDEGLISVSLPATAAIDAAASGDMAGIEFEITDANVTIGPRSDYRAPLTLSINLHPNKLAELGIALMDKTDTPAFNQRQWLLIAEAIRDLLVTPAYLSGDAELSEIASQIERAYHQEIKPGSGCMGDMWAP